MANNTNDHDGGRGEFCLMCGRSDKQAGKMIALPGGLKVCQDCMNKAVDMAGKMDFESLFSNPFFMQGLTDNPFFRGMQTDPGAGKAEDNTADKTDSNGGNDANSEDKSITVPAPDVSEAAESEEVDTDAVDDQEEHEDENSSGSGGRRPVKRVDSLGHFVFKYSDDGGRSWSKRRFDIPLRRFRCDLESDLSGSL